MYKYAFGLPHVLGKIGQPCVTNQKMIPLQAYVSGNPLWWNGMMFENFERRHVAHLLKIVQSLVCTIFCIDSKKKGPKCAGCFGEVFLTLHVLCTAVLDTWHTSGIHILVPQAETMSAICLVFVGEVQHGLFQNAIIMALLTL